MEKAVLDQMGVALDEIKTGVGANSDQVKKLAAELATEQKARVEIVDKYGSLAKEFDEFRRTVLPKLAYNAPELRMPGYVTNACARALAAAVVLSADSNRGLNGLEAEHREKIVKASRSILEPHQKAALTTSDIPLPTEYAGQITELILDFGVARKELTVVPIGKGTLKLPRMGARTAFGSIAQGIAFAEKNVGLGYSSLESHKVGGIVPYPREIDEQSFVAMGQFLAHYGAIEFARAEDTWVWLADGTATYESVQGIAYVANANGYSLTLGATKTGTADVTLANLRALRKLVNPAALKNAKYHFHHTWESQLRNLRLISSNLVDTTVYTVEGGQAYLDGFPIVWNGVLPVQQDAAAPGVPICFFGDHTFWWFGQHAGPRVDVSTDIYFNQDLLAVRFIEEIDVDYNAKDSVAVLKTAAA